MPLKTSLFFSLILLFLAACGSAGTPEPVVPSPTFTPAYTPTPVDPLVILVLPGDGIFTRLGNISKPGV